MTKVNIGIEGVEKVNALYASGMQKENTYDQIVKVFNENGVTLRDYLTEKYALSLDLRPSYGFFTSRERSQTRKHQ